MARLMFALIFTLVTFCQGMTNAAVHDVTKYGAVGDGKTNDAPAFIKAWAQVCNSKIHSILLIPAHKTFLTFPIIFQGPCIAPKIEIQVQGKVIAPTQKSAWKGCPNWITFGNITNLVVSGTGEFNARGNTWWTGHMKGSCVFVPRSLYFDGCNKTSISGIHSKDSPKDHFSIIGCNDVKISHIRATAPDVSPNTDGIHLTNSTTVSISDSVIGTGDDCVAIANRCSDINVTNVKCGPGHGISVGSLGKNKEVAKVENILVQHCTLIGTTNGARIKTWVGGRGYARSITYKNITLIEVTNPIIINQNYVDNSIIHDVGLTAADKSHGYKAERNRVESSVKISDVTFSGIIGTSKGEHGVTLNCSPTGRGCSGITIEDVHITSETGGVPKVNCTNANGKASNTSPVINCLIKD